MSIRIAKEADVPQILAIYAPYILNTTVSFEYEVPSLEDFTRRFRAITAQFPWLVWEEHGKILGYAYGSAPFDRAAYSWCAEPSIYLAPEAHRQGIGRQLYGALEKLLEQQGYQILYAIVTSENRPSLAFHESLGYCQVAVFPDCGFKHGRYIGTVWLEKRLNFVDSPSVFPISWAKIVDIDKYFR